MPDRKGHYLKPGKSATAPGVLFSVIVNPRITPSNDAGVGDWYSWDSAEVCCSHHRRGQWMPMKGATCSTPEALHDWMRSNADDQRRNYVVSPNGNETANLSCLWEHIDRGPVKYTPAGRIHEPKRQSKRTANLTHFRRLALATHTCLLDFARDGCRWIWLSAHQYFTAGEEETARSMGFKWPDSGHMDDGRARIARSGRERAQMWLYSFQRLSDWWRQHSRAPWGMTASGLSMGILRTYIKPRVLCTHNDAAVHQLERDACFGGRASTWYYGDIGTPSAHATDAAQATEPSAYGSINEPLTQVDVKSMYPALLARHEYPVKCWRYTEIATKSELAGYCHSHGVIARVTIETEVPEYPHRSKDAISYPVGRFTTTLTGPELLALRADGEIAKIHAVAVYDLGRPFADAADALIAHREKAAADGNGAWELLVKLISNGLAGKLAQRRGEWKHAPKVTPQQRYGEWYEVSAGTGKWCRYRAVAGIVFRWQPDDTGAGPYTASFAYVTARGRLQMRAYRDCCPARSIVSMDTDGLWVRPDAVAALRAQGHLGQCGAGRLRVVREAPAARFFGPRHYWTPGEWVLAGFHPPVVKARALTVEDAYRTIQQSGPAGAAPVGISVAARSSALAVVARGCSVGADGWAAPKRKRGYL